MPISLFSGMTCSLYVYVGYLFRRTGCLEQIDWKLIVLSIGIWGCQIINNDLLGCVQNIGMSDAINLLGSVAGVYLVLIFFKHIPTIKSLQFIGKNSSTVLCVHTIEISSIPSSFYLSSFEGMSYGVALFVSSIVRIMFIMVITCVFVYIRTNISKK